MSFATIRQERWQAAREEVRKWSKPALAECLGVALPTIERYEAEPRKYVSREQAEKLAEYMGIEVDEVY